MPVEHREVSQADDGLRLDKWFAAHFPGLPFGRLQKLLRTGQIRLDGGRVSAKTRIETGQIVRVPPIDNGAQSAKTYARPLSDDDKTFIRELVIYQDDDVIALDKPPGLAVQGGSGTHRHVDGLLDALKASRSAERPRLVHRLDKDTSGVLLLARHRKAAKALGDIFKNRQAQKTYWALVLGVPEHASGEIKSHLRKSGDPLEGQERVQPQTAGSAGRLAITHYETEAVAGEKFAWLVMEPQTGRTHQLRVHAVEMGHPIIGDGKYGRRHAHPGEGFSTKLHLHAHAIALPHPSDPSGHKRLHLIAPLPKHMAESFALLGFIQG